MPLEAYTVFLVICPPAPRDIVVVARNIPEADLATEGIDNPLVVTIPVPRDVAPANQTTPVIAAPANAILATVAAGPFSPKRKKSKGVPPTWDCPGWFFFSRRLI